MKLNDLEISNHAVKALKSNFELDFDPSSLNKSATKSMLLKVKGLIAETRKSKNFYRSQTKPTFMKLLFLEQALTKHISNLNNGYVSPKIVMENVEVEKSQVILAAQDMVDSVQKMLEQTSDMLVKELTAVSDSMTSEIGVNESQQFNQSAAESLTNLQQTLFQTKSVLQSALDGITGQGGSSEAFTTDQEPNLSGETPPESGMEEPEVPASPESPEEPEEPELPSVPGAGRAKR